MRNSLISILLVVTLQANAQDLFELVRNNDIKAAKHYEGSVNLRDELQATPLMWAVYSNNSKMVKLLLKKGADPELKGWIPLPVSVSNDVRFFYGSCLAIAAGNGEIKFLKLFIKKLGISPNDREINLEVKLENGWTPLQWAARSGEVKAVKYLISEGADVDAVAPTNNNQTALNFAINASEVEIAGLLLEAGADCNKTDWLGVSPLSYAFDEGSAEMVRLLISEGARFDDREHKNLKDELEKTFNVGDIDKL